MTTTNTKKSGSKNKKMKLLKHIEGGDVNKKMEAQKREKNTHIHTYTYYMHILFIDLY